MIFLDTPLALAGISPTIMQYVARCRRQCAHSAGSFTIRHRPVCTASQYSGGSWGRSVELPRVSRIKAEVRNMRFLMSLSVVVTPDILAC